MNRASGIGTGGGDGLHILWEDGDRVLGREWRTGANGERSARLAVWPVTAHPPPVVLHRLSHEYGLKDELDGTWAVRPLDLVHQGGRTVLVLEDPGGEPLARLIDRPMEVGSFLRLASSMAAALGKLHQRGLIHKDLKPFNILVNCVDGQVRLTGLGIASRIPRHRQAPDPPETIAGTLAYMAPEQTGRMNRSIDSRSDLYALGITFYQMLTSQLPFTASDPMEWVHCHIARRPIAPTERLKDVPLTLSKLIMKLLAKTAEERYQTAAGLESDLRHCLAAWETQRRINDFPLGEHDTPDRLLIPEKLYGREREIETLLAACDRIVKSGAPELVLVSGYSGIGKSSLIDELQKVLIAPRGLFAFGKSNKYNRDIPYTTLTQAFQSLIRGLLAKSEADLAPWCEALRDALGPNARLLTDLVPDLKLILGDPAPLADLTPQDAEHRFRLVVRRFIGVFARPEHPLALCLDDLQWMDTASLDLLTDLATHDVGSLLLVGAYRDTELDHGHLLTRSVQAIRQLGGQVNEIELSPLAREDVESLVADSLRCTPEAAAPLTDLVYDKTRGNPFFTIQFLTTLDDERLLLFSRDSGRWVWDLMRIRAKSYTGNVVDLMADKLGRLPQEAQEALQWLAALGANADFVVLGMVLGCAAEMVHARFSEALRAGLVQRLDQAYTFIHDRVKEVAYSLIPEASRVQRHLHIGRILLSSLPSDQINDRIFDIVAQLNRGRELVEARGECDRIAELNLRAGDRAMASTAYVAALSFFVAGTELLGDDIWERRYDLAFRLELNRAQCEFLTGELGAACHRLATLAAKAINTVDRAAVVCQRIALYTTMDRSDLAVDACFEFLRQVGIDWASHPTSDDVRKEYETVWKQLGERPIEALIDLPLMTDPDRRATLNVLMWGAAPIFFANPNLFALAMGRAANLSIEHGNSEAASYAYVMLGMGFASYFTDYQSALRFGRLGLSLVEVNEFSTFGAEVRSGFGYFILPWVKHIREGLVMIRDASGIAQKTGNLTYTAYTAINGISCQIAAGCPLAKVQEETEGALEFVQKARFGLAVTIITAQLHLVRTLRGLTPVFGSFNAAEFDEERFEATLEADPRLAVALFWYLVRKLQARVLADDLVAAMAVAAKAHDLLWTSPALFETAEYHFYAALAHAGCYAATPSAERGQLMAALRDHFAKLTTWAANCPDNFENRAALVGSEIARIEGRDLDAMHLYERAIRAASANGFVHNEALANELAARFYAARGFDKIAKAYLGDARYCYSRWGADGKVRQLDELYPHLREAERAPAAIDTIGAPVEQLDLATVIKVSKAVSGEIVLEKLIDTLMRTAIEHAGAERGLLILPQGVEQRIAAEATTDGDTVSVNLRDESITESKLVQSVLRYVLRTQESVILDDAAGSRFAADPYICQQQPRSVLCLPLLYQAKLIGVLYLENSLAPHVFSPARIAVLKLLAWQAAISLENSRLYRDVAQNEAKIRRLVDANIIGVFIFDAEGRIIEANDAFLDIVGYKREDIASGLFRWADLTPPEWLDRDARRWLPEYDSTGVLPPFEKEYFRKDGSRVPVLIGVASLEEPADHGVTFVLDLTERKQAEETLREVQIELAHASRVATLGQLTASIAHEISQPLSAVKVSGSAALRWLTRDPPEIEEAKESVKATVKYAGRAGDVISRIHSLVKKGASSKGTLDINEAIREVVVLTRTEAVKHGVTTQMQLADNLPRIHGDRVQLQQVMLNLIINAIQAMGDAAQDVQGLHEIHISTDYNGSNEVLVAVQDSGPGVSPEKLLLLFEPFYTTKPGGMGMGLSISRSIIEDHGGRLWASEHEAKGARFQFTIPVR